MLRAMDSLDSVELVIALEELFEVEITDDEAEKLESPRDIVDLLEKLLSNCRPNARAKALLKRLAKSREDKSLAEDFSGCWRREQIAAIIREMFRDAN